MREQKVLRMKARFWKTRGVWGGERGVSADDTRPFVPAEVEVVLAYLAGSPAYRLCDAQLTVHVPCSMRTGG